MKTQQKDNQFGQGSKIGRSYKLSMSPGRNPNIGGNESEYETSDEENFDEADFNEEDSEEENVDEDDDVNRSPGWRKDADGNISV